MPASARHVALLRGINVGKAKRIAMADLRALVAGLGYGDVATLLNSGNVVYTVPPGVKGDAAARIEQVLVTRLGVPARVTTLTAKEVAAIVARNPLADVADDPSRLLVTVLREAKDRARLAAVARDDWAPDAIAFGPPRVAYLWCPGGLLDSPLAKAAARALGDGATTRNWATLEKLHALMAGEAKRR
jgi:uncharacterized protein (DUF1697 family)